MALFGFGQYPLSPISHSFPYTSSSHPQYVCKKDNPNTTHSLINPPKRHELWGRGQITWCKSGVVPKAEMRRCAELVHARDICTHQCQTGQIFGGAIIDVVDLRQVMDPNLSTS